jgi:PAS domain S-box-containing protein
VRAVGAMGVALRVLLGEYSGDEAERIVRQLSEGGYDPQWRRVDSTEALVAALDSAAWDLVTCDATLPGLSAPGALERIRARGRGAPVIVVSGAAGDGAAATVLERGAQGFVSRNTLGQLLPAIRRELQRTRPAAHPAAEEAYRILVEHSLCGLLILQDGRIVFANPTGAALLGYPAEALTGLAAHEVFDLLHPDEQPRARECIGHALIDHVIADQSEILVARPDGTTRILEVASTLVTYQGRPAVQATFADVTERRTADERLQRTEERLRTYFEEATDLIFTVDAAGRITAVNRAACTVTGYSAAELIGTSPLDLVPEADRPAATAEFESILSGALRDRYDVEIVTKLGRRVWLEVRGRHIYEDGRLVEIFHIARDISERRRAEEEHARLSAAVEQAVESIMITNRDGTISYVNAACERMTGYGRDELIGKDPRVLRSSRREADAYRRMLSTLRGQTIWHWAEVQRRKDGTLYEVDVVVFPVYDGTGRLINYVGLGRDVTQERQVEAQLRQAHKLEAIERLAGGMAHDFNNQLTVAKGCVELLLSKLPADDRRRNDAEQINAAVDKSARLVRQLLTFSRPQAMDTTSENLSEVVNAMAPLLRVLLGDRISLRISTAGDLWPVRADCSRIEQIVMNLVGNARDAMMPYGTALIGDTVRVETANVQLDASTHGVVEDAQAGPYVVLTVSDNGPGMTPEIKEHIFEPFFTTKEVGKGTGMGLATVFGIVKQHGAYLTCTSQPGDGTTFRIYFPPDQQPEAGARGGLSVDQRPPAQTRPTVLVAEDEDNLRELLVRALADAGYRVRDAPDGTQALTVAAEIDGPIDLFVCDAVMPGENGVSVARRLLAEHPEMRVLLISGYLGEALDLSQIAGGRFLQKPFNLDDLLRSVRELLQDY